MLLPSDKIASRSTNINSKATAVMYNSLPSFWHGERSQCSGETKADFKQIALTFCVQQGDGILRLVLPVSAKGVIAHDIYFL